MTKSEIFNEWYDALPQNEGEIPSNPLELKLLGTGERSTVHGNHKTAIIGFIAREFDDNGLLRPTGQARIDIEVGYDDGLNSIVMVMPVGEVSDSANRTSDFLKMNSELRGILAEHGDVDQYLDPFTHKLEQWAKLVHMDISAQVSEIRAVYSSNQTAAALINVEKNGEVNLGFFGLTVGEYKAMYELFLDVVGKWAHESGEEIDVARVVEQEIITAGVETIAMLYPYARQVVRKYDGTSRQISYEYSQGLVDSVDELEVPSELDWGDGGDAGYGQDEYVSETAEYPAGSASWMMFLNNPISYKQEIIEAVVKRTYGSGYSPDMKRVLTGTTFVEDYVPTENGVILYGQTFTILTDEGEENTARRRFLVELADNQGCAVWMELKTGEGVISDELFDWMNENYADDLFAGLEDGSRGERLFSMITNLGLDPNKIELIFRRGTEETGKDGILFGVRMLDFGHSQFARGAGDAVDLMFTASVDLVPFAQWFLDNRPEFNQGEVVNTNVWREFFADPEPYLSEFVDGEIQVVGDATNYNQATVELEVSVDGSNPFDTKILMKFNDDLLSMWMPLNVEEGESVRLRSVNNIMGTGVKNFARNTVPGELREIIRELGFEPGEYSIGVVEMGKEDNARSRYGVGIKFDLEKIRVRDKGELGLAFKQMLQAGVSVLPVAQWVVDQDVNNGLR